VGRSWFTKSGRPHRSRRRDAIIILLHVRYGFSSYLLECQEDSVWFPLHPGRRGPSRYQRMTARQIEIRGTFPQYVYLASPENDPSHPLQAIAACRVLLAHGAAVHHHVLDNPDYVVGRVLVHVKDAVCVQPGG